MHFQDEEEPLPVLIPIKKKKNQAVQESQEGKSKANLHKQISSIVVNKEKNRPNKQQQQIKQGQLVKPLDREKVLQFDRNFQNIHDHAGKKQNQKSNKNDKQKQLQKSKFLIAEMMKKINARNLSQQLYPVTNETIGQIVSDINVQIEQLKAEAQRKENSLITNPNNQHLRKELQTLRKSIDRCVTISELYNEKINQRNKISILEKNIIQLKEQNLNLKIKINRGIQTIQNHMHNLPCQRQKQLKQELVICQIQLKKEKEMRQKLQSNISDIVLNFKRLYEEADTARLIVTKKLEEIQIKEKNLFDARHLNQDKSVQSLNNKSPQLQAIQMRKNKKNNIDNPQSDFSPPTNIPKTVKKVGTYQYSPMTTGFQKQQLQNKGKDVKKGNQNIIGNNGFNTFSMQEQIKKMRNNQINFARTPTK